MKYVSPWRAFMFMGLHMLEWINPKKLDALMALPKGFIVTLPVKRGSHLDNLTLVSQSI